MSEHSPSQPNRPVATVVDDDRRASFLSSLFGRAHFLDAENVVFQFMGWLSPEDYGGGFWEFHELNGQALYMVPPDKDRYRIRCATNGFSGEVSADAAGIIATLFSLSHLSFQFESDHLSTAYHRLHAYAAHHPEASAIFSAID